MYKTLHKTFLTLGIALLVCLSNSAWAEPRLYLFDCGSITFTDVSAFSLSNTETPVRELFVPCYLIEHGGKRLLWDGGLPLDIAGKPKQESRPGVFVEYKHSLIDQLASMQIEPIDIDYTAYSHFHYDHVGAANAFPAATMLIQQAEFDAAFLHAEDNPIFNPALYDKLRDSPRQILNGDHDVFGDGKVQIISAPGHTPGHQTLLLSLANTGTILLSGDLYHFEQSRALRRTPQFNTDAEQTLRAMDKVEKLLSDTGATLWIEHNKALADSLNKAPQFYD